MVEVIDLPDGREKSRSGVRVSPSRRANSLDIKGLVRFHRIIRQRNFERRIGAGSGLAAEYGDGS